MLRPFAREVEAELLLSSGDPSETHIAEMAVRAAADPRPFVVFYFSDFDPGGWTMPVAVARKFQAHRDLRYPRLDVQVHRVALTLDQVIAHDLPSVWLILATVTIARIGAGMQPNRRGARRPVRRHRFALFIRSGCQAYTARPWPANFTFLFRDAAGLL